MERLELEIEVREELGKAACNRLRRSGNIPAIIYTRGEQSYLGQLNSREFVKVASKAKSSQIFTLKSKSQKLNSKIALVKEIQRNYLSGEVVHVDLHALHDNEEITLSIPIQITGESPGVKTDGGVMAIVRHDIEIKCLPRDIPETLVVDVSTLQLNESIHARDLTLPKGVKLKDDPDETIVSIIVPREEEAATSTATVEAGATPADGTAEATGEDAASAEKAGGATEGESKEGKGKK